jgi:hypothetical protein
MLAGPQDVYCEQAETIDIPRRGFWPGNRQIAFAELPEECQRIVRLDYRTLWYKERHREV